MEICRQIVHVCLSGQYVRYSWLRGDVKKCFGCVEEVGIPQEKEIQEALSVQRATNWTERILAVTTSDNVVVPENGDLGTMGKECS